MPKRPLKKSFDVQGNHLGPQLMKTYARSERTIFIGPCQQGGRYHRGLNEDISDRDIMDYFTKFGTVVKVKQLRWRDSNLKRGYGFVEFQDASAANNALKTRKHTIKSSKLEARTCLQRNAERGIRAAIKNVDQDEDANLSEGDDVATHDEDSEFDDDEKVQENVLAEPTRRGLNQIVNNTKRIIDMMNELTNQNEMITFSMQTIFDKIPKKSQQIGKDLWAPIKNQKPIPEILPPTNPWQRDAKLPPENQMMISMNQTNTEITEYAVTRGKKVISRDVQPIYKELQTDYEMGWQEGYDTRRIEQAEGTLRQNW